MCVYIAIQLIHINAIHIQFIMFKSSFLYLNFLYVYINYTLASYLYICINIFAFTYIYIFQKTFMCLIHSDYYNTNFDLSFHSLDNILISRNSRFWYNPIFIFNICAFCISSKTYVLTSKRLSWSSLKF